MVREDCHGGEDGKLQHNHLERLMLAQPLSPMRSVEFKVWKKESLVKRSVSGHQSVAQDVVEEIGELI